MGKKTKRISIGNYQWALPQSKLSRRILGVGLVIGGILGFLPVLGFWMIPLGLVVLSHDSARVRRIRRRVEVKLIGWWKRRKAEKARSESQT
ncbi:MAG: hypothetical protein AAF468_16430 [Pseudomonadota bacterium]